MSNKNAKNILFYIGGVGGTRADNTIVSFYRDFTKALDAMSDAFIVRSTDYALDVRSWPEGVRCVYQKANKGIIHRLFRGAYQAIGMNFVRECAHLHDVAFRPDMSYLMRRIAAVNESAGATIPKIDAVVSVVVGDQYTNSRLDSSVNDSFKRNKTVCLTIIVPPVGEVVGGLKPQHIDNCELVTKDVGGVSLFASPQCVDTYRDIARIAGAAALGRLEQMPARYKPTTTRGWMSHTQCVRELASK